MENNSIEDNAAKKPANKKFILAFAALILVGGGYGFVKYQHAQEHETTDDAQVERNMSPIIPRVGGYVSKVFVKDNDMVKKGDTLFIIDSQDYLVKVQEAEAAVLSAESSFEVSKADVSATSANVAISDVTVQSNSSSIEMAQIRATQANNDYQRYNNLYKNHSIGYANKNYSLS